MTACVGLILVDEKLAQGGGLVPEMYGVDHVPGKTVILMCLE